MTNVILPFLMSMFLGRTIDLSTYRMSGANVYDDDQYEETVLNTLNSTYYVIQENSFPYKFFGIPADITLRIKTNFLNSISGTMGLDGLLKDTSWKHNSVVVSVTNVYRTVDRTLKNGVPVLPDWTKKVPVSQTHYAHSLSYGGWSVVLFQFRCDIAGDVPAVRKVLERNLGVTDQFGENILEKWQRAVTEIDDDDDIRGRVTINIHVYSTVPIKIRITNPKSLLDAIASLPKIVGSLGQPLYMNLRPLHDLDNRYAIANENIEMLKDLETLDKMFDDVKVTKVGLTKWVKETATIFEAEEEDRISKLLNDLNECIRAMTKVGSDASLFAAMDGNLVASTFEKYLGGLQQGVSTYNLAFRRLKEEIDADCQNTFLPKIRGLLRVYPEEVMAMGELRDGLQECQRLCQSEKRCRSIGYAKQAVQLDMSTGLYYKTKNLCWVYYRSASTATVHTPNGMSGDLGVYDRTCY